MFWVMELKKKFGFSQLLGGGAGPKLWKFTTFFFFEWILPLDPLNQYKSTSHLFSKLIKHIIEHITKIDENYQAVWMYWSKESKTRISNDILTQYYSMFVAFLKSLEINCWYRTNCVLLLLNIDSHIRSNLGLYY